jgi:hypothetical protein
MIYSKQSTSLATQSVQLQPKNPFSSLQITRIRDFELAKVKEILVQFSVQHFFEVCLKSFLSSCIAVSLSLDCSFVVLFCSF